MLIGLKVKERRVSFRKWDRKWSPSLHILQQSECVVINTAAISSIQLLCARLKLWVIFNACDVNGWIRVRI